MGYGLPTDPDPGFLNVRASAGLLLQLDLALWSSLFFVVWVSTLSCKKLISRAFFGFEIFLLAVAVKGILMGPWFEKCPSELSSSNTPYVKMACTGSPASFTVRLPNCGHLMSASGNKADTSKGTLIEVKLVVHRGCLSIFSFVIFLLQPLFQFLPQHHDDAELLLSLTMFPEETENSILKPKQNLSGKLALLA